jgi:hypothetical protein
MLCLHHLTGVANGLNLTESGWTVQSGCTLWQSQKGCRVKPRTQTVGVSTAEGQGIAALDVKDKANTQSNQPELTKKRNSKQNKTQFDGNILQYLGLSHIVLLCVMVRFAHIASMIPSPKQITVPMPASSSGRTSGKARVEPRNKLLARFQVSSAPAVSPWKSQEVWDHVQCAQWCTDVQPIC